LTTGVANGDFYHVVKHGLQVTQGHRQGNVT
jgi:hypothetical protein